MQKIIVSFSPSGIFGGKRDRYRAKLASEPGYHAAGTDQSAAISDLLLTLKSSGRPHRLEDYEIEYK